MKSMVCLTIGSLVLLLAGSALAVPPGPGQPFDCSGGGDTSCAADDAGCVSNTKNHLACSRKIGLALAKAVYAVTLCHAKQASQRFNGASENGAGNSEENCENNPGNSAKENLDDVLDNLQASGKCDSPQLENAAATEAVLFGAGPGSLDAGNGTFYCDATSGTLIGDDDAGSVPATADNLKCAISVAKNAAKLLVYAAKCHDKMNGYFFKAKDFNEEACEDNDPIKHRSALDRYNKTRDKLLASGICPACLDGAAQDQIAADTLASAEGATGQVYPCGLP
jgi:hypothetical protein